FIIVFFFQAEDGIRDRNVTGVQTCALPISDIKLQIAGISTGFDQTVVRHDTERGKFSVLYYRDGQIIAADCANAPLDFMAVKQALGKGKNIDPAAAAEVSTMLKSLIA